jgi:DNA-directed RNA polymerase subunit RPC12/RpoP
MHLYYKRNFLSSWRLCEKTLYTTDHGAISEIPYTDITKLIKKQGLHYPPQSYKTIQKITDEYLSKVGCFIIESDNGGKSFLESNDPINQIPIYIDNIYRQWGCSTCKNTMSADDDNDYSGEKCLVCGRTNLVRVNPINREENIKRITALVEKNKIEANNGNT